MNTSIGIYKWTNLITGQVLIGQTNNFRTRKRLYLDHLRKNKYGNKHFQRSWNKYGEENFLFEILETTNDIARLTNLEQSWLDHFRELRCSVFNQQGPVDSPNLGRKFSEEIRAKMSRAHKGRPAKNKGIPHSQDTIEKIRQSKIGLCLETRIKMSVSAKLRPANRKGIKLSEEHKKKILESKKKRKIKDG